jgi:elongator complex protein 4
MSFRKRSVVVPSPKGPSLNPRDSGKDAVAGTRPSPLDGRLTISTGTRSLDSLLSGHAGLPLGTSIFVEENGTTDFGGALLRYFAAEGIVQGHHVHVLGAGEGWGRELPGLTANSERPSSGSDEFSKSGEKMKIAWRYERLGDFGRGRRSFRVSKELLLSLWS